MDIKLHILRWQQASEDNPAVLVLAIIVLLTALFIITVLVDGYLKKRKDKKHQRKK
jgi:hypothetical protein